MSTPYYTGQPSTSQTTQPATPQSSQPATMSYAYPLAAGQQPFATQTPASTQAASTSASGSVPSADPKAQSSRLAAEEARKDRTLSEFLLMLDDYEPLIPDEVTDYYLQRVGFDCQDARLKRLLALAAQKFVSDIAADAYQHARIRSNAAGGRARANQPPTTARDKARTTLTMEDLSAALAEYGINSRKPEFYM